MQIRTRKALGVAAAAAAIAASIPLSVTANSQPTPPSTPAAAPVADPQGPGCDAFKKDRPSTGPGSLQAISKQPVGTAIAGIPNLKTFSQAIAGQLNPQVNIVPVLENGPYVVFAPTDEAFAEVPPAQLEQWKTDAAALYKVVYYHAFLGLLGPDDVKGQRPTQQGNEVKVTGKGGDIKVNDTAKVLCGGIEANNARIYIIDKVLDPNAPPEPLVPTPANPSSSTTTTTTTTTTSPPPPPPAR